MILVLLGVIFVSLLLSLAYSLGYKNGEKKVYSNLFWLVSDMYNVNKEAYEGLYKFLKEKVRN